MIITEILISFAKILVIVFGFVMALGSFLTLTERKYAAFVQKRLGPMRAEVFGFRLGGLFHLVADGIKMILKEDFTPDKANKGLHALAPALGLFPAMIIFAIVPFMDEWCSGVAFPVSGQDLCFNIESTEALLQATNTGVVASFGATENYFQIADLNAGLLYMFAVTGVSVYGSALAGWSSNAKFSLLGGLRAGAQMISYEVTMGLSLAGILMIYGTIDLNDMVREQGTLLFGVVPMWGIVVQPLAFVMFLTASIAESKRAPFDMPEAESELVAGYFTEYSAMKFGIFMLGEFIIVVFIGAICATLFLGGWHLPWLYADGFHFTTESMMSASSTGAYTVGALQEYANAGAPDLALPYWLVAVLRVGSFILKILFMIALQMQIRWTLPRFRYDQIMHLGWKILLPLSLANLVLTAIVILLVS